VATSIPLKNSIGAINYDAFLASTGSGASGNLLYKSLDSMLFHYDKDLLAYNTKLKDFNSIENQAKRELIKLAKGGIEGLAPTLLPTANLTKFLVKNSLDIAKWKLPKDSVQAKDWTEGMQKGLKSLLGKGYDELSYTVFGKEFFTEPQRPSMPSATVTNMRLTGTISDTILIKVANFMTPGTYQGTGTLTAHNYPAWNNPVGLFALLKTPSMYGYKGLNNIGYFDKLVDPFNNLVGHRTYYQKTNHYFRLQEVLKYKLNHALDFDFTKTKVYGLIEVEVEPDYNFHEYLNLTSTCFRRKSVQCTGDFELLHGTSATDKSSKLVLTTAWLPLEDFGEKLFNLEIIDSATYFYSNAVDEFGNPINPCWGAPYIGINQTETRYRIKKVKLKLMPDMYFTQQSYNDNKQINTTQVFTYLLYDQAGSVDLINQKGGWITEQTIRKHAIGRITYNNVTITTTSPYVTEVIGNTIYINADTIYLYGTIQVLTGYKVVMRALKYIYVYPTAIIKKDIELVITNKIYNIGKIYEATNSEVESFCTGANKGYHADALTKRDPIYPEKKIVPNYKVISYPNPLQNQLFVEVESEEYASYKFVIHDLMGKTLLQDDKRSSPNPSFEIDLSTLAKGMYILEVISEGQKTYKSKFIKM
jgi:hypothetical protein